MKSARSSIERRFVLSILWVSVIPMTLALLIGYFAAREAQHFTVLHNLRTTVRKTAGSIQLVIHEREQVAVRVAQSPVIVDYLRDLHAGKSPEPAALERFFAYESASSPSQASEFFLYDKDCEPLIYPPGTEPRDIKDATANRATGFIDLNYVVEESRYFAYLLTPIYDAKHDEVLGYLHEKQSVDDLLDLILDEPNRPKEEQHNRYEVIFYSSYMQFTVFLSERTDNILPPPTTIPLCPDLAEKMARNEDTAAGSFFLWRYPSQGKNVPVLLAYHRLDARFPVYVAVHQPTQGVFATINIAAVLTLLVSALVIAFFCLIAYRIVNNSIIRPVSLLNEGAQIIRQGNFDLKVRTDAGGEIDELATSFNQMASALRTNVRQLKESEEKYRNLVLSMRDARFQTDAKDKITFINPAGAFILGYESFDDLLGKKLVDFFLDKEEHTNLTKSLVVSPYVENIRIWLKRADDQSACVEFSGTPIFDTHNSFAGIDGSFRDVTHSVILEKEVQERAERITFINQIANLVNSSVEAGLVYESLNREIRHLVAYDYAAISLKLSDGTFETRQLYPEPKEGPALFPRMDDDNSTAGWVAQEGRYLLVEDLENASLPIRYQFPGSVKSILCVPLHALDGIAGALTFGSDLVGGFTRNHAEILEQIAPHLTSAIRNAQLLENLKESLTNVNQAKEKLHAANIELKSLDEMKVHLLSNVSHELRTPLVAVMGYTDMILNSKAGPITDQQEEYLNIVMRNVEKLVVLIENLLDFSRVHRGSEEMLFTHFDVVNCILSSMQSVRPTADARSIPLHLEVHDSEGNSVTPPLLVDGDKGKLGQVFNNLISNAVKFNSDGGSVTIDLEVRKKDIRFSVIDTGIGIPKEAQDKIFNRFYQYDSSSTRKYGGTGIGLAIAQDFVGLHGGRITVSSEEGKGTTFRFTLPRYEKSDLSEETQWHMVMPTETHLLFELVSQDRALSSQIRQILTSEGMDIIHAVYPAAATTLVNKYNPDCIIVDTESGPTGRLLLEELLSDPSIAAMPMMILTDNDRLYESFKNRIDSRIKRSFRKSTLLSGIHYALGQKPLTAPKLGANILYVDNDEQTCLFVKRCLKEEGYKVDYCHTGAEALKQVNAEHYWLVMLELALTDADGWDICRQIKNDPALEGIKVFIVTSKTVEHHSMKMQESGADSFLMKPFKADEIASAVETYDPEHFQGDADTII
ncbi:MAG: ATP-binding protein [Candidatus Hydrogenedentales bacterium]